MTRIKETVSGSFDLDLTQERFDQLMIQLDGLLRFQNAVVEAFDVPQDGRVTDGTNLIEWFRERAAELAALKARLAGAEAATQALMKAIKPFADAVFNDNGDMTVGGFDTYESCIAAYWARKKTRAYFAARPKDKTK